MTVGEDRRLLRWAMASLLGALLALSISMAFGSARASASTGQDISVLPVLDPLNAKESEEPRGLYWAPLAWVSPTHSMGIETKTGWTPWSSSPSYGAYWKTNPFSDANGEAASFTMQVAPSTNGYVGLWLDMSEPGTTKSGYQLRWKLNSGTSYTVTLSKWSSGTETVLASNSSVTIAAGTTMAIADTGGSVSVWKGTGGALTSVLSASDTTYSSGYAGIEGFSNASRSINFRAGPLMGAAVDASAVLDNLERNESPLANGKWSKTSWAGEIGGARMSSGKGYGSSGPLASAYWNQKSFNNNGGWGSTLVAGTVGSGATPEGQYLALWLNMSEPSTARSGLEARFTGSGSNYKVELSKWTSGTRTVLASTTGFSLPVGTTMALTRSGINNNPGGNVVLWTGTAGSLTPVLSATATNFGSGYAGLEVNGSAGTIYNFKAGRVGLFPPLDTTITSGATGIVTPRPSFSFVGSEGATGFECSLDGGAYSTCTSPKSYTAVSEGAHTFRVRAVNGAQVDETPAERSFTVVTETKAVSKVPLLDNLERNESPLANGKWSKTSWAGEIGGARMSSGKGYGSSGLLASAYWNPTSFSGTNGTVLVAGTVGTGATPEGQYLGLWLDMPSPSTARSGYEARFTGSGSNYKVELSKWSSGTRTVLASTTGFSLPVGTTMALTETPGGSLELWTGTSTMSPVLTASDSTYTSGYAGLEVNGTAGTIYNFKAGQIDITPPETTITGGPQGIMSSPTAAFTFSSSDGTATFECQLDSGAYSPCTSPKEYAGYAEGGHTFRVRAVDPVGNQDETPATRGFTFDIPPETTITSPTPTYTSHENSPITFTTNKTGGKYYFECKLDSQSYELCSSPYTLPKTLANGWHTFRVRAYDNAEVADPTPAEWTFNTNVYAPAPATSKLVSPEEGKKTSHDYTLKAEWGNPPAEGGVTGVTFQIKLFYWDEFRTIPAEYVLDGQGKPVQWPLPATSNPGHTDAVFFDYPAAAKAKGWVLAEEDVKFRAVFDGGKNAAGASQPVTTEFLDTYGGVGAPTDASEQIGPVNLDLLTGQYTISRTDVSIPIPGSEATLEFARTYESNYRNQKVNSMVLDGMWQPSAPTEQEFQGEAWMELRERHEDAVPAQYDTECEEEGYSHEECLVEEAIPAADWIELLDNEGGGASFDIQGGTYVAPDYMKEYVLTKVGETFELADPVGVHTVFVKNDVGIQGSYRPSTVSWQATAKSARMLYEHVEGTGEYRLSKMIAPAPAGIACTDANSINEAGCRTLSFQYFPCTCGGWTRLSSITYYNASGNPGTSQKVAEYKYDSHYRLIAESDPRTSPALEETYSYGTWGLGAANKMMLLTPPGEEPWEIGYYEEVGKESAYNTYRLKTVSRASLLESPSKATTTIAYGVPLSGSGAPYDTSSATVAKWGQSDYPVDATAIFPPTQIPSEPPSDYSQAIVHYMDPDGYEVNTASASPPGASGPAITTSETDTKSNVVRSLSAQSRLVALEAADSVARSHELDSHSTYNTDGTRMLESWGPLHKVRLETGETVEARVHTTVEYDKEAPTPKEGEPWPNLPTKETVAAAIPGQADKEARITETKYDWTLKKPIEQIVDPSGLNLRTVMVYDSSTGQVKEARQPSNPEGGGAGTIKAIYYTAGFNAANVYCGDQPAWAGLPCVTTPAAAPSPAGSNPPMPWTWFTEYSSLDQPIEIREKVGEQPSPPEKLGGILKRTTTFTYNSAGRLVKRKQTGTGEGTSVPAIETTYKSTTGVPESQRFVCEAPENCTGFDAQEVKTTYDTLGRPIKYEDADGGVSGIGYDLMGRPVITSDGKGTQAITYDEKSGVPIKLVDSAAGAFTATYDADGKMIEQILPDGLAAQTTYDPEGNAISLRYQKVSNCSSNCTWLQFSQERSIRGQIMKQTGTLSSQEYSYDKAGRLTLAKDTNQAGECTTRSYALDKDSNRTSLTTRGPKAGGACDTESAGTKKTYSYDTADRLIGEGITYDNLGRITSLPSAYSGGGTLTTAYYVNNLTRSQTQDGLTNTYELDAALRERQSTQSGTMSGTQVYHYAFGSDSPLWTQEGSAWSRNVGALGGGLGAIQKSTGETTLQLASLHGDIVATASLDPNATKLLSTQGFDEFGNPKQSNTAKYGWLGSKGRRTELPSGVVQMGARSYVPMMGRFLTPDPVTGGSANSYDYGNADPVNEFDLSGARPADEDGGSNCRAKLHVFSFKGKKRMHVNLRVRCGGGKAVVVTLRKVHISYEKAQSGCFPHHFCEGPNCHFESDCEDSTLHESNVGNPRNWKDVESLPCEPGKEYQVTVTITYQVDSVIVIGSGKQGNGQPGAVGGGHGESLFVQAQQYCGHSIRGQT